MQKAYKYRIYPTKKQEKALNETLGICCELYNAGLQERRDAYKTCGITINYQNQQNQLPSIKVDRPELKTIHSQVLQDTLKRLDKAMQAFFRRLKTKEKAGFPRFKARKRYHSFTYAQSGFEIVNNRLNLSKIGHVKIKLHRAIEGKIKTCTIRRSSTGKWFACLSCEVETKALPAIDSAVGIDAGISALLTLSDGSKIDTPHFFRGEEKALAKEQRKLSKLTKGSKERRKQAKRVARVHERIANKRTNYAHQVSHALVMQYSFIVFEHLRIANMLKHHQLAKSIADAAWHQIIQFTSYKAENAVAT